MFLSIKAAQRENELLNTIQQLQEHESELRATIRQQQDEIVQIRKHSHGPMGLAPVGSSLSSAVSTSSLVSNANSFTIGHNTSTHSTCTDLESLTRDQLIHRCQREIKMKEQVSTHTLFAGVYPFIKGCPKTIGYGLAKGHQ